MGGQVAHPWKVWWKNWKEGGKKEKGKGEAKEEEGEKRAKEKEKMERERREIVKGEEKKLKMLKWKGKGMKMNRGLFYLGCTKMEISTGKNIGGIFQPRPPLSAHLVTRLGTGNPFLCP